MQNPFLSFCTACLAGLLSTGLQAQIVDSSGNNSWNFPGLNVPSNIHTEVTYDPVTGMYKLQRFIGSTAFGAPTFLTVAQYQTQVYDNQELATWRTRWAAGSAADQRVGPSMVPDMTINNPAIKEVFGSDELDIRPQGSAQLKFGLRYQHIDNPIVPERNRKTLAFDFDQDMQINATGKLGDRLDIKLNYDTKATFAFENKMKLNFTGLEDDIVKSLEMGDVSLPTGGSLITGAQSLFGIKGKFQFGNTTVTTVMAEQRSQGQSLNIQGGGTTQEFSIEADNYEANRHFFMSHYFRDHYEDWLTTLPVIQSPIQITKVEICLTNRRSTPTQVRNILAFLDLGEAESHAWRSTSAGRNGEAIFPAPSASNLPANGSNRLAPDELTQRFSGIRNNASSGSILSSAGYDPNVEYAELSNARKLLPNEYSFHPQLGFITLNMALNQYEVLAIAYQYTANGRTYQVGEFANDGVLAPQALVVKLLKHSTLQVKSPIWDLMMKNVYSLNAYQLSQEDFRLEIMYRNDATGMPIPFLPNSSVKDQLLVQVMGLDRVNSNGDPFPDGLFDFIPQVTVLPQTGRIILPVLEPFGSSLAKHLPTLAERKRYVFQQLYDSTLFRAQEQTQLNKFLIKGRYKGGGGSLIQLNAFNIPRGSINVTAGGRKLMENQDYTVDYALGQVRILNESLMSSGMPIKVNFENNSMFNMQAKTFAGTTVEHRLSKDWVVGGSLLRLSERPLTQKVNAGDEPISNRIWGLNSTFNQDLPSLTRALDALPFVSTNAPSKVQLTAEFAQLLPGSPRGIKINGEATTYLDDFENSQMTIDLRGTTTWHIASTPEGLLRYPEASLMNDWASNANRGRLS
ncbi:MAG: cell surface protein SprA [Proteobacteria bacterium]|nr:cell surface protein SprA [Pseudomonadota bacterium]